MYLVEVNNNIFDLDSVIAIERVVKGFVPFDQHPIADIPYFSLNIYFAGGAKLPIVYQCRVSEDMTVEEKSDVVHKVFKEANDARTDIVTLWTSRNGIELNNEEEKE